MMKFKALCLVVFLSLFSSTGFTTNLHVYPQTENNTAVEKNNKLGLPGYCEIEIINNSYSDLRINGIFDDGTSLQPFNVYSFESPHYISLYYYGYCHAGMDLDIDTLNGYHVFGGYVRTHSTIRIMPYLSNKAKAEIKAK